MFFDRVELSPVAQSSRKQSPFATGDPRQGQITLPNVFLLFSSLFVSIIGSFKGR